MVRTRNSVRKTTKSPIKKKSTVKIATIKIGREKLERCKEWLAQQKREKGKIQSQPIDDLESDASADEDELCLLRLNEAAQHPVPANAKKTKIYFACEWQKCNGMVDSYDELQAHMKLHLQELPIEESYDCEWDLCKYDTNDLTIFKRHVLHHVYMTNLKTQGEQLLLKKEPLPACMNDSRRRNMIRDTETKYLCLWQECRYEFEFIQDYFDHMRGHCIHEIETHKENNRNRTVQCRWLDCQKQFTKRLKMTEHMRTHTGERFVACANCGSTFNSYVKFYDHFKRQSVTNNFKCSECFQSYATEELLNNHMYTHINCIKCTMCDMTCPSPAALAQHFRYRHIKERPYKCSQCDYGAVTKWDLNKHILNKHQPEETTFYCDDFGCDYSCTSLIMMRKHQNNVHGDGPNIYSCHCCNRRYQSGGTLSRHLIKNHGFQLPSGHRRFTYRQDMDGIYRVQTTRIESLEVSEQIIATRANDPSRMENASFKLAEIRKTENGLAISVVESKPDEIASVDNGTKTASKLTASKGRANFKHHMMTRWRENDRSGSSSNQTDTDAAEQKFSFEGRFKIEENVSEADGPLDDENVDASSDDNNCTTSECSPVKCIDDFSVMQKYLKTKRPKNKIIITVDEVDERGNIVHTETRDATEFHL